MINFTDAHEFGNPKNFIEAGEYDAMRMDLHNNAVGRSWGRFYKPFTAWMLKGFMSKDGAKDQLWIIKERPPER